MKHLVIIVVVLAAAVGGGLSWWALSGDDDFLEASGALAQACRQAESLQDVDILFRWESTTPDGKLDFIRLLQFQVSGPSILILWDERPKEAELYVAGTLYKRSADGKWTKQGSTGDYAGLFAFAVDAKSICPDLAHFTYAGTDKLADDNTKKFTAPTLSGKPYGDPPKQGELGETRDWEIWIDEDGYIVKSVYTTLHGDGYKSEVTALYSGHGEPNILPGPPGVDLSPQPTPTPEPYQPLPLSDQQLADRLRELEETMVANELPEDYIAEVLEAFRSLYRPDPVQ